MDLMPKARELAKQTAVKLHHGKQRPPSRVEEDIVLAALIELVVLHKKDRDELTADLDAAMSCNDDEGREPDQTRVFEIAGEFAQGDPVLSDLISSAILKSFDEYRSALKSQRSEWYHRYSAEQTARINDRTKLEAERDTQTVAFDGAVEQAQEAQRLCTETLEQRDELQDHADKLAGTLERSNKYGADADRKLIEQAAVEGGLRQHIAALEGEGEDGFCIEAMTRELIAFEQYGVMGEQPAINDAYEPLHDAIYDALLKAKTMGRGVAAGERERMRDILQTCHKELDAIWGFHGDGLEVINWHQNGDTEPFDNFLEENDHGAVEASAEFLDDAEEDEAKKDV